MEKIQRYSRIVRLCLFAFMALLPCLTAFYWFTVDTPQDVLTPLGLMQFEYTPSSFSDYPPQFNTRLLALLASSLPCVIVLYGLWQLQSLFSRYQQGEVFSERNAKHLQKLGLSCFYWVGGYFVYGGLISVILSFNNPPGERVIQLTLVGTNVGVLLCGMIILVIGWVMQEAQRIHDENLHTI